MTWTLTFSGLKLDLIDPSPEAISIIDIAKGLSREARFAGQSIRFYSVAQHSVAASYIVPQEFALEALLHDASEAYIKDIPRPLKNLLPDYRRIEQGLQDVIRSRFGLPCAQSYPVTQADHILLATERRDLMPKHPEEWACISNVKPLDKRISTWSMETSERMFMQRLLEVLAQ